jgi:hypothetical protein
MLALPPRVGHGLAVPWGEFAAQAARAPAFGAQRLADVPAYLATVDDAGAPRVHPVTPITAPGRLFLFMEPTSPKGHDIVARGVYALHGPVPADHGTEGEFYVRGRGERIDAPHVRAGGRGPGRELHTAGSVPAVRAARH